MAERKIKTDNIDSLMKNQQKASEKVTDKPKTEKTTKPNSDYIRLDLKPSGYDLKAYVNKRCGDLSLERDKKISSTAFIQELIIKDMEENQLIKRHELNDTIEYKLTERGQALNKVLYELAMFTLTTDIANDYYSDEKVTELKSVFKNILLKEDS